MEKKEKQNKIAHPIYIKQSLVFDRFLYKLSLCVSRRNVCGRLDSKENFSSYNIFVVAFTVAL